MSCIEVYVEDDLVIFYLKIDYGVFVEYCCGVGDY